MAFSIFFKRKHLRRLLMRKLTHKYLGKVSKATRKNKVKSMIVMKQWIFYKITSFYSLFIKKNTKQYHFEWQCLSSSSLEVQRQGKKVFLPLFCRVYLSLLFVQKPWHHPHFIFMHIVKFLNIYIKKYLISYFHTKKK